MTRHFYNSEIYSIGKFIQRIKLDKRITLLTLILCSFIITQKAIAQCTIDTDMDLICDSVDLDNDNDGILDADECAPLARIFFDMADLGVALPASGYAPPVPSAGSADVSAQWNLPAGSVIIDFDLADASVAANGSLSISTTSGIPVFTFSGTNPVIVRAQHGGGLGGDSAIYDGFIAYDGISYTYDNGNAPEAGYYTEVFGNDYRLVHDGTGDGTTTINWSSDVPATSIGFTTTNILSVNAVTFALTPCTDTDLDGLPDHLDLDSDNDGCPDAIEGDGGFTYTDIQNDTLTGGVDADGVPIAATSMGQAAGSSTDDTVVSDECDPCNSSSTLFVDIDMDGVGNLCDLDNDNDGILDADECAPLARIFFDMADLGVTLPASGYAPPVPSVGSADVSAQWNLPAGSVIIDFDLADASVAANGSLSISATSGIPVFTFSGTNPVIVRAQHGGGLGGDSGLYDGFIAYDGISYTFDNGNAPEAGYYTQVFGNDYRLVHDGTGDGTTVINWSSDVPATSIGFTTTNFLSVNAVTFALTPCTDTDLDGLPDHLDLDSDNDGCPDAIEGDGGFTYTDIQNDALTGGVDADGVPIAATSTGQAAGSSTDDTVVSDECDPCNSSSTLFVDIDMDGVGNLCDLDNDNDGILDADECAPLARIFFDMADLGVTLPASGYAPPVPSVGSADVSAQWNLPAGSVIIDFDLADALVAANGSLSVSTTSGIPVFTFSGTNPVIVRAQHGGGLGGDSGLYDGFIAYDGISYTFDNGNAPEAGYYTQVFGNDYRLVHDGTGDGTTVINWSSDVPATSIGFTTTNILSVNAVTFALTPCTDTDLDGLPDHLDLDSDNDGCPDALEGDGGFTFADILNDTLTGGVDTVGVPIVATSAGQGAGSSTDDTVVSDECDPCNTNSTLFADIDMDGIGNVCDLDNDNDGILDTEECTTNSGWIAMNPSRFGITAAIQDNSVNITVDVSADFGFASGSVIVNITDGNTNNSASVWGVSDTKDFTFKISGTVATEVRLYHGPYLRANVIDGFVSTDGVNYTFTTTLEPGFISNVIGSNHYVESDGTGDNSQSQLWESNSTATGGRFYTTNQGLNNGVTFFLKACNTDTDGDGILNYLDLDSDNDGCLDAIEGDGGFTFADILNDTLTGGVDTVGVPIVATSAGQGVGSSQDSTIMSDACITIAENDISQTAQDTPVDGNVLTNDSDPTGDTQMVSAAFGLDMNGDTIPIPVDGTPTDVYDENGTLAGTIAINPDGSYTFTPDTGYSGSVPVDYVVEDSTGATDTASLDIDVIATPDPGNNDPPVANDDTNTTEQGGTVTTPILGNDTDPDGDALTVTAATGLDASGNPVPLTATPQDVYDENGVLAGQASIAPNGDIIFTADSDFVGDVPIDYTIEDPDGLSTDATLVITVEPDNGNATYGNDDASSGLEGEDQTGNVLDNDNDPEGDTQTVTGATDSAGNPLTVDGTTANTLPGGGTLVLGDDGTYTYVPAPGFVGTEVVVYEVCDDGTPQACETQSLYLTTLPVNDTEAVDDFANTPMDTPVGGNVLTNDEDDQGDNQTVTMVTTVPAAEGTVVLNPDGTYVYTPAPGFAGETSFVYEVCDDATPPECEEATVYIEVLPPVDPTITSVIANPDQATTEQGATLTNNVFSNDYDPEGTAYTVTGIMADTDGDGILDVVPVGTAPTMVYGLDEDGNPQLAGTFEMSANGDYVFVADAAFEGKLPIEYEITDANGDVDTTTLTIKVVPAGENNTFAGDDAGITDVNIPIDGSLMDNDTDPEGDVPTVNAVLVDSDGDGLADDPAVVGTPSPVFGYDATGALVPAGTLVINADGTYTYTPAPDFTGNVVASYTICDGGTPEACDEATLDLTVLGSYRDYGDASGMYPAAWHTKLADSDTDDVLDAATAVWLGAFTSFESESDTTTVGAAGDTFDDAMVFGTAAGEFPTFVEIGTSYPVTVTLNGNQTGDDVYLGMWIDWDADGVFDDFHAATGVASSPVDVSVTVTPPATYVDGTDVVVRLRADDEALAATDFEGELTNGEVEDYLYEVILPIELASFEGQVKNCETHLTWVTLSELNTSHFEIQASSNGQDFRTVESLSAAGISNNLRQYNMVHNSLLRTTYYRLKTIDLDGAFSLSKIIVVRSDCESIQMSMELYPNPTKEDITFSFISTIEEDAEIQIVDVLGRVVHSEAYHIVKDINKVILNTKRLAGGVYFIKLRFDEVDINTEKFIKTE